MQSLDLGGTQITGDALKTLAALPALQSLNLGRTRITDADLQQVAVLTQLKSVDLQDTNMTDVGAKQLAALKHLEYLDLDGTKLTMSGRKRWPVSKVKVLNLPARANPLGAVAAAVESRPLAGSRQDVSVGRQLSQAIKRALAADPYYVDAYLALARMTLIWNNNNWISAAVSALGGPRQGIDTGPPAGRCPTGFHAPGAVGKEGL